MLKTPPLQTATATIDTLCGRLQSASLLEDRRAAILGLRSFAKQYPASVASGSLRELIVTLRRDGLGEAGATKERDGESRRIQEGGDVDTIRLILETLLMLFNPDISSPEAGDEIAFFMADEFSKHQDNDNIIMLLSLLDPTSPYADYYSRLYSVQLLSAISAARPERLQECILAAPLGISRLVGVLDDAKDAVRNAGLLLLVDLTTGAPEDLTKIVVFEDVFAKIFSLIRLEGGLAEAGITAQDCLSLLANLIKGSASNQAMFRESGCVTHFEQLLHQSFPPDSPEAPFIEQSREKASWGLLQLLRLFLVPGDAGTSLNQTAFYRAGIAQVLLDIGFSEALPARIRSSALRSASALIEANSPLQEHFASLTVIDSTRIAHSSDLSLNVPQVNGKRSASNSAPNSARPSGEKKRTYIIEALLDLSLEESQAPLVLRSAACGLIHSYLAKHDRIKAHFIQRAIAGHAERETAANILNTLLHPPETDSTGVVFASQILQDLITDNIDAKTALAAVKEGNENEGEDVLTSIQTLGSQLQIHIQPTTGDEKLVAAYSGLLVLLLWDFPSGVDSLLAEGSSLFQALLSAAKSPSTGAIVSGLAAVLIGAIYEFSTKDSPIPRRTLAPILQQKLGRPRYLEALLELRRDPVVRDIDLNVEGDGSGDQILSKGFVDLLTFEYARLRNAIDKDPSIEVLPASAAEAGVNRDILDDLRQQVQTSKDALTDVQQELLTATQKGEQDRMAGARELQTVAAEVERLRKINHALHQGHEAELEQVAKQSKEQREAMEAYHQQAIAEAKTEAERQSQLLLREHATTATEKTQELERRIAEMGNAHRAEADAHATVRRQLETVNVAHNQAAERARELDERSDELQLLLGNMETELHTARSDLEKATAEVSEMRGSLTARNEEAVRLNERVRELREELKGREEELKTERAGFADLERELEAARASGATGSGEAVHTEKLASLETELETLKESEKSAKDELESMLLVMGDIEAKRDVYKAKVKELGGEVTDDEEEEGEDEESADDNEEDDVD